jgi:methylenetetrahydrofolate reductase (NADPH)
MGIHVPVIPGPKAYHEQEAAVMLPKIFHVDLPTDLSSAILQCKTDAEVRK